MRLQRVILFSVLAVGSLHAVGADNPQQTLDQMPRYDRYERLRSQMAASVERGISRVTWSEDGKKIGYNRAGKNYLSLRIKPIRTI